MCRCVYAGLCQTSWRFTYPCWNIPIVLLFPFRQTTNRAMLESLRTSRRRRRQRVHLAEPWTMITSRYFSAPGSSHLCLIAAHGSVNRNQSDPLVRGHRNGAFHSWARQCPPCPFEASEGFFQASSRRRSLAICLGGFGRARAPVPLFGYPHLGDWTTGLMPHSWPRATKLPSAVYCFHWPTD